MTGIPHIKSGLRAVFAIAVLAAALVVPAQAFAKENCSNVNTDPTAAQYCSVAGTNAGGETDNNKPEATTVADETPSGAPLGAQASGGSSLPFTGLDVGILVLVAAGLAGAGFALRRLTSSGAQHG